MARPKATRIRYKKQEDGTYTASISGYDVVIYPEYGWYDIGYNGNNSFYISRKKKFSSRQAIMDDVKKTIKGFGIIFYDEIRRQKRK